MGSLAADRLRAHFSNCLRDYICSEADLSEAECRAIFASEAAACSNFALEFIDRDRAGVYPARLPPVAGSERVLVCNSARAGSL